MRQNKPNIKTIILSALVGVGMLTLYHYYGKSVEQKPLPSHTIGCPDGSETPKVNNPNVVKPTSTEIEKSKYKLIAENIELKERIEEINANYKALDHRTKTTMAQQERYYKAATQDAKDMQRHLAKERSDAERMKKMSLARFASLVNVMKENNELREWKKVAEAAGLKLPKGPVTKPDYVLPPKTRPTNPAIPDYTPRMPMRKIPTTNIPIPDGLQKYPLPIRRGIENYLKEYSERLRKAAEKK